MVVAGGSISLYKCFVGGSISLYKCFQRDLDLKCSSMNINPYQTHYNQKKEKEVFSYIGCLFGQSMLRYQIH